MSGNPEGPLPPQESPAGSQPNQQPSVEVNPQGGLLDRVQQQLGNNDEPEKVVGRRDIQTLAAQRAKALRDGMTYEEVDKKFGPIGNKARIDKVEPPAPGQPPASGQPPVRRHRAHADDLPYQNLGSWAGKETHLDRLGAKPIPEVPKKVEPAPSGDDRQVRPSREQPIKDPYDTGSYTGKAEADAKWQRAQENKKRKRRP